MEGKGDGEVGGIGDGDGAFVQDSDVKIVHEPLGLSGGHVGFAGAEENGEVFGGGLRGRRGGIAAKRQVAASGEKVGGFVLVGRRLDCEGMNAMKYDGIQYLFGDDEEQKEATRLALLYFCFTCFVDAGI